eukprot:CAMPEP_0119260080 /NCGR_PEP_ID=MMETSP1329-20130426/638_1 /TAXON_ID=114041 /ORGANISM="Genus nov. species nov., Strain RCC1024" /LENGTH=550 /DNA_ID=CAMNT_0007259495 /DNA_START=500 /DNA_END=2152 /DNA_ORIENTATION=+
MPLKKLFVLACLLFMVHPMLVIICLAMIGSLILHPVPRVHLAPLPSGACLASSTNIVVYGGGVRGLYTGALLACAGQRVTVLIPQSSCDGGATAYPKGAPCKFILERCEFGQVSRYENLLSPCFHASKPVTFEPVGCAQTGWVHSVLVARDLSQPVPLRSGSQAWVDDISRVFSTDRSILLVTLRQVAAVLEDMFPFMVEKLPGDSILMKFLFAWNGGSRISADYFLGASNITTANAANRIAIVTKAQIPVLGLLKRICAVGGPLREECASFAAWCASVAHGIDGYHVPRGGITHLCESLRATIEACGGEIRTDTVVQRLRFVQGSKPSPGIAITTTGAGGIVGTLCATKVVLGTNSSECLHLLHNAREDANSTSSGSNSAPINLDQPQALLILRTLIAFSGTCEDLDTPRAIPVFWRKHTLSNDDLDRKTVTFRDAPNSVVACVVESPISSKKWELDEKERTRFHIDLLNDIAGLFPKTKGMAQFVTSLSPSQCTSSQIPTRYSTGWPAFKSAAVETDGIYLAFDDFALSNAAGSVIAGYLAAHAVLAR